MRWHLAIEGRNSPIARAGNAPSDSLSPASFQTLGHDLKRCQKPVLITPLRVAITPRRPCRKRPSCPGDLPKSTQSAAHQPAEPPSFKRGANLLIARVLGFSRFSKDQPGRASATHVRSQAVPDCPGQVGDRDLQRTPGHERLDGQGTKRTAATATTAPAPGAIAIDRGPSVEPTALACLGLWSCRSHSPLEIRREAIQRGADWLQTMQKADGSLGISSALPEPGWATPHAMLLWNALGVHAPARRRAAAWLLEQKGAPSPSTRPASVAMVGHDTTLVGWPWIAGTHSWVEPTAMAILALDREGLGDHPRVAEGIAWSSTGPSLRVDGTTATRPSSAGSFDPSPGPTGLALLALAAQCPGKARDPDRSIRPSPICCGRSPRSGLRSPWPGACSACGPGTPAQSRPPTG